MLKKRNAFKVRTPPFPQNKRKERKKQQQIQCAKWQLK